MKNIVILFDGTGIEFGPNNTNVVKTYSVLERSPRQIPFYDPGVGTGGWEYSRALGGGRALLDFATGRGFQKNIEDAYRFLMKVYEPDDRIFAFGFSRGAFAARSLTGMLHKCGLLEPGQDNLVEYASEVYNTVDNEEVAEEFRNTFSRRCPVYLVGVWDTVESLLLNAGRKFHDSTLNPEVSFGYQALALDEARKSFPASLWDETKVQPHQTVEQVWFAGVHSDVGGFYPECGLSNVTLQWMLDRAERAGLRVHHRKLDEFAPDPLGEMHDSRTGIFRLQRPVLRPVAAGARVHSSVLVRRRDEFWYQPENLPSEFVTVD